MTVRQRFLLTLGSWLIGLLAIVVLIILPIILDIKQMNKKITDQRQELEAQYEKGLSLKSLRQQLEKTTDGLSLIEQGTLMKSEQLTFVTTLEKLAQDQQVGFEMKLSDFEHAWQKSKSEILAVAVSIKLTGSYERIANMVMALEHTNFLLTLSNFSIQRTNDDNNQGLTAALQMTSYWRKL